MGFLGFCLLFSLAILRSVHGFGGEWSTAHATFYGGGDASGTMGKNQNRRYCCEMLCISLWVIIRVSYCVSD